jgi:hypothetical protein
MKRLLLCLAVPTLAWGCSCIAGGPPCEAAWKHAVVFAGTVVQLTHDTMQPDARGAVQVNGFLGTHATFAVTEGLLGMEGRGKQVEIRTGMGGGDCGYAFQQGERYVVYADQDKDGLLVTGICSRTAPVDGAQEDLAYLRTLPDHGQTGYVYGVAGDVEAKGARTGIPGAAVTLTGPGKSSRMTTGDDGSFRFDGLPPGKYSVSVAKEGYSLAGGIGIGAGGLEVHAGGCGYASALLAIDRRITGKLTGADGLPAANVQVELVPTRPPDRNQLPFPVAQARTGSDGTYELRNIRPGEYYLGINLAHTPTKDMPYARYFYPGTEDAAQAGIVIVPQSAGTIAESFPIPAPQTERAIAGSVYWPDGRPAEGVSILLEDVRWPWQTNTILATTDAQGRFEIAAFDGTAYRIHAVKMASRVGDSVSADPVALGPATDLSKPQRLILTRKGHSAAELTGKGLEAWRAGRGLLR